jgi:hypothetical protein
MPGEDLRDEATRMSTPIPKDAAFRARIQASFDKQGLMRTLGASILHIAPEEPSLRGYQPLTA